MCKPFRDNKADIILCSEFLAVPPKKRGGILAKIYSYIERSAR